jgi:arginyl-tRNA--protein-N-Asp/Glu arginylyltransferase
MQTYNSFNQLAAANSTTPLQSQMSVFNETIEMPKDIKEFYALWKKYKKQRDSISVGSVSSDEQYKKLLERRQEIDAILKQFEKHEKKIKQ